MKTYTIPHTSLKASRISYGCMKLGQISEKTPEETQKTCFQILQTALDLGINFFDHANIYARGKSETVFGEFLKANPGLREKIILQSKCGIRFKDDPTLGSPHRYDFSYEHIMESTEASLKRLQTDHLDILLLHRPDPLVEPDEVARAFDDLKKQGKVSWFGVSNHTRGQIELLRKSVQHPIVANQLQLSIYHHYLISEGIIANIETSKYALGTGTLDYCRQTDILVQAWSPVGGKKFYNELQQEGTRAANLSKFLDAMAGQKKTTPDAILLAWLLKHPAGIMPIVGSSKAERVKTSCAADELTLDRLEWHQLFNAGRGENPP